MKIIRTGSLGNINKPLTKILVKKYREVTVTSSSDDRITAIEQLGATAAIGRMEDVEFLTKTFKGADAVYVMVTLGNASFFETNVNVVADMTQLDENYEMAIEQSGVKKVIKLSAIGAHLFKVKCPLNTRPSSNCMEYQ
jgi:uncharacterized protein YbjT (DUF2867 family)